MLLLILSFRVMGSWGNGLLSLICRAASSIALREPRIILAASSWVGVANMAMSFQA